MVDTNKKVPLDLDYLLDARTIHTSPARATEIANMRTFGLEEFIEITGIGEGKHGIYSISEANGVSINMPPLADFDAVDQKAILQVKRTLLSLKFPCTPADFSKWHDTTRGEIVENKPGKNERAPSDFPLHRGFIDQINTTLGLTSDKRKNSVTSHKIKEAFNGIPPVVNGDWWDLRVRDPSNYGLSDARVKKGKAGRGNPSLWNPVAVAAWIIEKFPVHKKSVIHACKVHFPDHDTDFLA